jgi:hypothetical protein
MSLSFEIGSHLVDLDTALDKLEAESKKITWNLLKTKLGVEFTTVVI